MVTKVGNLRVFCNGKIFVGPDWKTLFLSFLLIFVPSLLYLSLIAIDMGHIFWISFMLVIFNLMTLLLTGLSNPGVIPRRPAPSGLNARFAPPTRTKDFKINGYTISTKYCTTCHIYRVPRCSHCTTSDNCVEKFDHYCPWVGTCIGRRNYRYFLMFVLSGTLLCLLVCSASVIRLIKISSNNDDEFDTALKREPIAIVLVIYTFVAVWFIGGLSAFHIYLVLTNQTTYEHIRRRFGQHGNPYNKGMIMNLFEACCQLNPPYDWENDGSQVQSSQESSRNMKLPPGVVLNPTVIAMEKEARERAERAKASGKGSFVDVRNAVLAEYKERQESVIEYPDSVFSSGSSVEGRQYAMTGGHLSSQIFPYASTRTARNSAPVKNEIAEVEEGYEELSNPSIDRRTSSRRSLGDLAILRQSLPAERSLQEKFPFRNVRSLERKPYTRGDSANTSLGRFSEMEMVRTKQKGKSNEIEESSAVEEMGHVDGSQVDFYTTLSSATSNAPSEISSHWTDRSDVQSRKQESVHRNRQNVMSMQDIMSSQRNIPNLHGQRKHESRFRAEESSSESIPRNPVCSSEGFAKLRSLRTSGENVLSNLRAKIKRQNTRSQELPELKDDSESAQPVLIDIDRPLQDTSKKIDRNPSDNLRVSGQGTRSWVSNITSLSQPNHTELTEGTHLFEALSQEGLSAHRSESSIGSNNTSHDVDRKWMPPKSNSSQTKTAKQNDNVDTLL